MTVPKESSLKTKEGEQIDNGRIHFINRTGGRDIRLGTPDVRKCPNCAGRIVILAPNLVGIVCEHCRKVVRPKPV